MSNSFLNRFVQKLSSLGRPAPGEGGPHVRVAIFGKHPGWDDHIPDLGLNETPLIEFKRWLYDGITRNVDNGEWDKLEKSGHILPFGHTLFWFTGADWIAARCWQSVDGKGRDRYPMIAAALCSDLPFSWAMREAAPAMRSLQDLCVATRSAAEVERLYQATETALKQNVPSHTSPDPASSWDLFRQVADRAEMGPERLGFLRVLYHIEREHPWARKSTSQLSKSTGARATSLRVPICADTALQGADLWLRFLSSHPGMPFPLLACLPDAGNWIDLVMGIPGSSHLYGMLAPVDVLPMTTDVPYTLNPDFIRRIDFHLDASPAPGADPNPWP